MKWLIFGLWWGNRGKITPHSLPLPGQLVLRLGNLRWKGLQWIQYQRCFNNRPASYHGSPVRIRHKLITCSILRVLSVLPTGRFLYHGKRLVSAHESEASPISHIVACVDDGRKTPQSGCLFSIHRRVSREHTTRLIKVVRGELAGGCCTRSTLES